MTSGTGTLATPARGGPAASACEMLAALAAGQTTASRLAAEHLERVAALEPEVRAWAVLDQHGALARAAELERQTDFGLMHAVPVGIKDNIDTADLPTAYGSVIHADHRPRRDAACVAALRLAGANILGKTVSAEFAHKAPGATRNPWNPAHTPGGSSSGSAAAVACAMVPVALGSQTTGSVIRPAAYCGVVGFKPTYGELNPSGMLANTPAFDTLGVMARSVADVALVRRALLDDSVAMPAPAALAGVTVGVCETPWWPDACADTRKLIDDCAGALERAGARLTSFDGSGAFDGLEEANIVVSGYQFARTMAHERRVAVQRLSADLRDGRMADGLRATHSDHVRALRHIERARRRLDAALGEVAFVITPAAPGPAPHGLHSTGSAQFNMPWTTLHTPAITLPVGRSGDALPLGLQLVASRHDDDALLSYAAAVFDLLGAGMDGAGT